MLRKFSVTLVLLVATQSLAPRPSHAIIGAFTGGAASVAGGVLLGIGAGIGALGFIPFTSACGFPWGAYPCRPDVYAWGYGIPGAFILAGIILLDEKGERGQLMPLSPEVAQRLQLTESERISLNNEIEEANLVAEEAFSDLRSGMPREQIAERYESMLSPETVSALKKVVKGTIGRK